MPYRIKVMLRALEPIVVVGFTGTVVLSLVVSKLDPALHDAKPKPISVTPLYHNGKPIIDAAAVAPGDLLEFRVGAADEKLVQKLVDSLDTVELFGKKLAIEAVEFSHIYLEPLPRTPCFKAEFQTPLRFATPPLYKRRRPVFEFLPRPLTLFKSAVKHARQLGLTKLGIPFLKWIYTYVALTDFGCQGRCVHTVRLPKGGIARGFVGWALYKAFNQKRLEDMWHVLRLIETFNVGTGRGMGLGVVKITPLQCDAQKPKN